MPEYIFDHLKNIKKDIKKTRPIILFLDYDGTLVDFKKNPDEVKTPLRVKNLLKNLVKIPHITLVVITGRTLDDIKNLIDNNKIIIGAIHGLKIEFPNGKKFVWGKAETNRATIQKIKNQSIREFNQDKEVLIEDKDLTLAIHYRQASEKKVVNVIKQTSEIFEKFNSNNQLELLKGSKVIEIRPKGWNKGKAIEEILDSLDLKNNYLPIYAGDDTTDEDAFRFLKGKGINIFVSNNSHKNTNAEYYVKKPDDVIRFLTWFDKFYH